MAAWATGIQLGPYVLIAPIGAGGMGEVWKARDTRLDRMVAIKRLKSEHSERFQREARAIAAFNHPHICQIYDVGPDYLVMEYIEGKPLKGPLPLDEALRLAMQIAGALEEAHARGILHRDLKPGNILVTDKGLTKLLDFGLAKLVNSDSEITMTIAGAVMGTPAYMSPEQAEGKPVDERSDVFSFGAVLYEMLCGRRAFEGMASVLRDDPTPLQSPVAAIVSRCLTKQPGQRYQTVTDIKTALEALATKPVEQGPSIAVLPFADMSPGKDNEYFSDGLAEEIINSLTHVPGLKVIARTSAFAFKGQQTDIRKIAEALGVTSVLEGSVRKAGNRIRVNAQLITSADGSHLWSERYDRDLADVFAVQDEIAAAIAAALQVKLSAAPRKHTPVLAAYEEFLKARHHLQRWTPDSAARARECLERAVAIDPGFALAHSDLGWCFFTLVTENQISPREAAALMSTEAQKALEIDPSLTDAHAVLGMVAVLDYDWNEAGRRFRLAMAREPIQPLVRDFYSLFYLAPLGRMEEAEEQLQRALQEDPLNLLFRATLGWYLLAAGRLTEGESILRQVLELDENFWLPYIWLGAYRAIEGRLSDALRFTEKAYSFASWNLTTAGQLAGILERTGDASRAQRLVEKLGDGTAFGAPGGFIAYHVVRSEIDLAAYWFEKAIEQRDTRAPWLFPKMLGDLLTSSPHWPRLAKMMNLPETAFN
jgi:serine/threonine-protein kinase